MGKRILIALTVLVVSGCSVVVPTATRVAVPVAISIGRVLISQQGKLEYKRLGKEILLQVGAAAGENALQKLLAKPKPSSMGTVIVRRKVRGSDHFQVFRVEYAKTKIYVNGETVQRMNDKGELRIDVVPGTPTTVAVLEDKKEQKHKEGEFSQLQNWYGLNDSAIDLDEGRKLKNGDDRDADLSARVSGVMKAENGARVARWPSKGQPSLAGCVALAPDKWGDKLEYLHHGQTYCVQTSKGRFGRLTTSKPGMIKPKNARFLIWETATTA